MMSPALSSAATSCRWGLPRGLIVLLGGAAIVIIVAGVQGVAWLIGPACMALIVARRHRARRHLPAIAARRGAWPTEPRAYDPYVT